MATLLQELDYAITSLEQSEQIPPIVIKDVLEYLRNARELRRNAPGFCVHCDKAFSTTPEGLDAFREHCKKCPEHPWRPALEALLTAFIAVVETDGFCGSGLMRKRIEEMKAAIAKAREAM